MQIREIIEWLEQKKYRFHFMGNEAYEISGFASLESCKAGNMTWIKNMDKYMETNNKEFVECAVIQKGLVVSIPNQIISNNSKEIFFAILEHFWGTKAQEGGVGEGTYISPESVIDPSSTIGNNCSIVGKVSIGKHTIIEDNVCIRSNVQIGYGCIIHSGTVIGKDGFGFAFDKHDIPVKVPHFGGVIIGDRVEIGANCVIDRGTIDNTIIGDDVKIDSLSLVAHNVVIESGTMIIGCTSLGGSSHIGTKSYIGPHGFIRNQKSVGNNSLVGMGVIVSESIGDNLILARNDMKPVKMQNYRRLL